MKFLDRAHPEKQRDDWARVANGGRPTLLSVLLDAHGLSATQAKTGLWVTRCGADGLRIRHLWMFPSLTRPKAHRNME